MLMIPPIVLIVFSAGVAVSINLILDELNRKIEKEPDHDLKNALKKDKAKAQKRLNLYVGFLGLAVLVFFYGFLLTFR